MRMKFKFQGTSYEGWGPGMKESILENNPNAHLKDSTFASQAVGLQFMLL